MKTVKLIIGKWVAISFGVWLGCCAPLLAQSAGPAINVTSEPSGATVILTGELTVAGVTPTSFSQRLAGLYKITAFREGYETHNSSIVFSGRDATSINIQLRPKTRVRAGVRSLIIPGWGQRYSGAKTKGTLMTAGALIGGLTVGILHLKFDSERDEYFDFLNQYNSKRTVAEREAMLPQLYQEQKEAYDAEQARNLGGAILAGFWIYNFLDAVLFFPDYGIQVSGANLSLEPQYDGEMVSLTGKVTF